MRRRLLSALMQIVFLAVLTGMFSRPSAMPDITSFSIPMETIQQGGQKIRLDDYKGTVSIFQGNENQVSIQFTHDRTAKIPYIAWGLLALYSAYLLVGVFKQEKANNTPAPIDLNLIKSLPDYKSFLDDDPERKFLYDEDLPNAFLEWLLKRK
ncbi:hypothetical protein [Sulfuriroseicoccus oceanibius]|uniref:Uncharacterized protein n=1 Tax=Sulfuriroseicoccus oceanibius TaxID=2707525 RepID=A0A6B3LG00_9BACT|nr:hypothetical protein [Sulfuriroseicoccus oceanibius]QQL44786.1 hypothetical protein G3M56_013035 [Sulfuriroseicoccus oceanibius]